MVKGGKKKGLSEVIEMVLLICLILVCILVIFLWSQNLSSQAATETLKNKLCIQTDFTAANFCYETLGIEDVETGTIQGGTHLKFNVRNNSPHEITGFLIFLNDKYGNTIGTLSTLLYSEISVINSKTLITDFFTPNENLNQIIVIPEVTNENNETILCNSKKISTEWGKVKQCLK